MAKKKPKITAKKVKVLNVERIEADLHRIELEIAGAPFDPPATILPVEVPILTPPENIAPEHESHTWLNWLKSLW